MKRLGSRTKAIYLTLLVAVACSAVIAVASAQAAPVKKKFAAYVVATDPSSTSFEVTLVNDGSSQQTLGSADFTAPGLSIADTPKRSGVSSLGHSWSVCTGSGGVLCNDQPDNVVEFRAASSGDALQPGESVSFIISANAANCANAVWGASAKQSNDYSGTNNLFNLAANDLDPLGSFTRDDIPSIIDRSVTPTVTFTVHAKDTCGNPKTDYTGASPYSGALSYTGLTGASPPASSGLSWSHGNGQIIVTPVSSQFGNQFTFTDNTTGITTSSTSFDIVDELCTKNNGKPCQVDDGQYQKNSVVNTVVSSPNPTADGDFLGLGFDNSLPDCTAGTKRVGSIVMIDPSASLGGALGFYQVTITFTKAALVGTKASPSNVIFCLTKNNGGSWSQMSDCAKDVPPPCVASRSGTSGGGLQFVLSLPPGDPGAGGHI